MVGEIDHRSAGSRGPRNPGPRSRPKGSRDRAPGNYRERAKTYLAKRHSLSGVSHAEFQVPSRACRATDDVSHAIADAASKAALIEAADNLTRWADELDGVDPPKIQRWCVIYWGRFLDSSGRVICAETMCAIDDEMAIEQAYIIAEGGVITHFEVWDGDRLVGRGRRRPR
jgi:hypothetical protein